MKYIFILSQENIDLAKTEVLTLANTAEFEIIDNVLIIECKKFKFKRM